MNAEQKKQELRNQKILPLTNDYVFKRIFAKEECKEELKDLLEGILEIKIEKVEVKNGEIPKNILDEKLARLDIRAKINNEITIDIEMQTTDEKNLENRSLAYASKMINAGLKIGQDYKELKKTIIIWILNFNYFETNAYHNIGHIRFDKVKEKNYVEMGYKEENGLITESLELHFIEMPKFIKRNPGIEEKQNQWLWLIAGEGEKVKMAEKVNEKVKKAKSELDIMSMDEKEREMYEDIEFSRWVYATGMSTMKKEGIEEGRAKGREEGREEGRKEGQEEERRKIVRAMLKQELPLEMIIKITKLSKEEIEKIEKEVKNAKDSKKE